MKPRFIHDSCGLSTSLSMMIWVSFIGLITHDFLIMTCLTQLRPSRMRVRSSIFDGLIDPRNRYGKEKGHLGIEKHAPVPCSWASHCFEAGGYLPPLCDGNENPSMWRGRTCGMGLDETSTFFSNHTSSTTKSPWADYLLAQPKHFLARGLLKANLNPNSLLLLRNLHQLVYPCKVADPA